MVLSSWFLIPRHVGRCTPSSECPLVILVCFFGGEGGGWDEGLLTWLLIWCEFVSWSAFGR